MKKLVAFVLTLVCVLGLVGCSADGNEVMEDFVGIVTNISNDNTAYLLVKVTDSGSSNLKIGDRVIVQVVDGNDAEYAVDDYIKVAFNGVVEEIIAVSIANKRTPVVFSIEKIENSIA